MVNQDDINITVHYLAPFLSFPLLLLLAAALIPLFFFGKAYLGRISGGCFLLVYLGYAVARISNRIREVQDEEAAPEGSASDHGQTGPLTPMGQPPLHGGIPGPRLGPSSR